MYVVFVTSNLNWITFHGFADSSQVIKKLAFNTIVDKVLTMFCAENDMSIDF